LFNPAANDIVEMGTLTFQVTDSLPDSDILIGWQTLKNHRILCRCHNNLADRVVGPLKHIMSYKQFKFARPSEPTDDTSETASVSDHTDTESVDSAVPSAQLPREGSICAISTSAPRRGEPTSTKRHISELFKYSPDSDGEPEKEDYLDEALQADFKTHEGDTLPTDIVGSRWMRRRLSNLLKKYTHQFKKNVQKTPASIPSMVFNVKNKL
jgi:hypothetical protein